MNNTSGPARFAFGMAALPLLFFGAGIAAADDMNPMPPPQPEPGGPIQGELDAEFDQIIDDAAQAQLEGEIAAAQDQMANAADELFLLPPGAPPPGPECVPVSPEWAMGTVYFFCGGGMPLTNPPVFVPGIGGR